MNGRLNAGPPASGSARCDPLLRGVRPDRSGGAVGNRKRGSCILLDQHNCQPAALEFKNSVEYSVNYDRCQPHRRLVEQKQTRIPHQRPTNREHLLLATR